MNNHDIQRLARASGIHPSKIALWHSKFSQFFRSDKRFIRPDGTLSVTEIAKKYGVAPTLLVQWRKAGLPSQRGAGRLIVIKETDLKKWIAKVGWKRRPLGRPRRDSNNSE
jgi:hypothetical protein